MTQSLTNCPRNNLKQYLAKLGHSGGPSPSECFSYSLVDSWNTSSSSSSGQNNTNVMLNEFNDETDIIERPLLVSRMSIFFIFVSYFVALLLCVCFKFRTFSDSSFWRIKYYQSFKDLEIEVKQKIPFVIYDCKIQRSKWVHILSFSLSSFSLLWKILILLQFQQKETFRTIRTQILGIIYSQLIMFQ